MDGISGKRAVDKYPLAKRSGLAMRETPGFSSRSPHPCNKHGCGSRVNIMKVSQTGGARCPQKAKSVHSSDCVSEEKEVTGSSSKIIPSISAVRSRKKELQKKIPLSLSRDSSETSSTRDVLEVTEVISPPGKIQKGVKESSTNGVGVIEVGSSSAGPSLISKSRISSNSKNSGGSSMAKSVRQQPLNPNTGQRGSRNPRVNSTSDVVPSNTNPYQNRSLSKRKDFCKGQNPLGETSSSRGRKIDVTLPNYRSGISISESRRTRTNGSTAEVHRSVPSVGVGRSSGSPSERSSRSTSSSESRLTCSRFPHRNMPIGRNVSSGSAHYELSSETLIRRLPINNRPGSRSGLSPSEGSSSPESLGSRSRLSVNWESIQQYAIEGIQEVLSALERIDRDDLNYEQLISLETSLLLNNPFLYDQHRDMRMDIDNMSYEELLALEERMGSVSTALTDEAIKKCLKRDLYSSQKHKRDIEAAASVDNDDTKCSICQEEYVDEDAVGRLRCEHLYHMNCINQWLRLKNWCPVCKGPAEPSPSSSQS